MISDVLFHQLEKNPCMAPCDAVKLLYQQAFGCGHLLADQETCANFIQEEIASLASKTQAEVAQSIGHGLCRLHLDHETVTSLPPALIAKMMQITQEAITPDFPRFEESLQTLQGLANANVLPFDGKSLSVYVDKLRSQGFPPVSHSKEYHRAYAPAYRVVLSEFAMLVPIISKLLQKPCLVAIDGDCGGGKTTLALRLSQLLEGAVIGMDDFFLPPKMRNVMRFAQPGGNVHHERFASEILAPLMHGEETIAYDRFDCATNQLVKESVTIAPITIIEGSYSHHPAFESAYEKLGVMRVFVRVEEAIQQKRLQKRNETMFPRFVSTFIPLEKSYQQAYDIKTHADIIISSLPWEWEDEIATHCD